MSSHLSTSVLFFCTMNTVRSPMAAALMRGMFGGRCFVSSAGVQDGETDFFALDVMQEAGFDLSKHQPHAFSLIDDASFDLFITLSLEAKVYVQSLGKSMAFEHEHWDVTDPTLAEGNREQKLDVYRKLRQELNLMIEKRFSFQVKDGLR